MSNKQHYDTFLCEAQQNRTSLKMHCFKTMFKAIFIKCTKGHPLTTQNHHRPHKTRPYTQQMTITEKFKRNGL